MQDGVENTRLEAKAKDTKKNPGPRTAFSEDRPSRGQEHRRKCSPNEKEVFKNFFRRSPKEETKKGFCKFSARFLAFYYLILTVQKKVLSSSQGQGNFRELEASRQRPKS